MMKKKRFRVIVDIERCVGYQCFLVDADDEDDAKEKILKGEGYLESEKIDVYSLDFSNMIIKEIDDEKA